MNENILTALVFLAAFAPALHAVDDLGIVDSAYFLNPILYDGRSDLVVYPQYLFPRLTRQLVLVAIAPWFNNNPQPYHTVSALLHALTCALFFRFSVSILKNLSLALIAVAGFAIGPHVEIIAQIDCVMEQFSTLFIIVSLMAWRRHLQTGRIRSGALTLFYSAAAYLSRATSMCLPVLFTYLTLVSNHRNNSSRKTNFIHHFSLLGLWALPIILLLWFPPTWHHDSKKLPTDLTEFAASAWESYRSVSNTGLYLLVYPLAGPMFEHNSHAPFFLLGYLVIIGVALGLDLRRKTWTTTRESFFFLLWSILVPLPYIMLPTFYSNPGFPFGYCYPLIPGIWLMVLTVWRNISARIPRVVKVALLLAVVGQIWVRDDFLESCLAHRRSKELPIKKMAVAIRGHDKLRDVIVLNFTDIPYTTEIRKQFRLYNGTKSLVYVVDGNPKDSVEPPQESLINAMAWIRYRKALIPRISKLTLVSLHHLVLKNFNFCYNVCAITQMCTPDATTHIPIRPETAVLVVLPSDNPASSDVVVHNLAHLHSQVNPRVLAELARFGITIVPNQSPDSRFGYQLRIEPAA